MTIDLTPEELSQILNQTLVLDLRADMEKMKLVINQTAQNHETLVRVVSESICPVREQPE